MLRWRQVQRENFTRLEALIPFLELDQKKAEKVLRSSSFPLNLPRRLAQKIKKNCLDDPIFRQFVPLKEENLTSPQFSKDPVGDLSSQKTGKLLHKYQGRALLVCTSSCAMHCRYCFRKHFPYEKKEMSFESEIFAIAQDPTLEEIILSGGDPLSLSDAVLGKLLNELSAISHVKRIRFHTRFIIGVPERVDSSFLQMLSSISQQLIFVVHINHPQELDEEVIASLKAIQKLGIPIFNQAVLLRGVNDEFSVLEALCKTLINVGVTPYYLHQLDRVEGSAHFEVSEDEGRALITQLRESLPGYGVPLYVQEIAGETSKTPLF